MNPSTQALTLVAEHLAWYNRAVGTRDFSGFTNVLHPDVQLQVLPNSLIAGRSAVMDALHRTTPAHALTATMRVLVGSEIEVWFHWAGEAALLSGILHLHLSGSLLCAVAVELQGCPLHESARGLGPLKGA